MSTANVEKDVTKRTASIVRSDGLTRELCTLLAAEPVCETPGRCLDAGQEQGPALPPHADGQWANCK